MTNQEINEAVAKKLGWTITDHGHIDRNQGIGKDHRDLPNYCHDIQAAWEIVNYCSKDEMKAHDLNWEIHEVMGWDHDSFDLTKLTPRAICLAFLKLP